MDGLADNLRAKFSWETGLMQHITARATLSCVLHCGGHHSFKFQVSRYEDGYQAAPIMPTACFKCGNVVSLTQSMVGEVLEKAEVWAAPQIKRYEASQERRQELVNRLWQIIKEVQPDEEIREAFWHYRFDMIGMFYRKAKGDEGLFAEFVSGDWGCAEATPACQLDRR